METRHEWTDPEGQYPNSSFMATATGLFCGGPAPGGIGGWRELAFQSARLVAREILRLAARVEELEAGRGIQGWMFQLADAAQMQLHQDTTAADIAANAAAKIKTLRRQRDEEEAGRLDGLGEIRRLNRIISDRDGLIYKQAEALREEEARWRAMRRRAEAAERQRDDLQGAFDVARRQRKIENELKTSALNAAEEAEARVRELEGKLARTESWVRAAERAADVALAGDYAARATGPLLARIDELEQENRRLRDEARSLEVVVRSLKRDAGLG